jgi:transketolase N-terminal domain/subunit
VESGFAQAKASDIDQRCINTIRTLSIDAIQKANSGHPGTPMALAPVAYTIWQRYLRFDPTDPIWPNRDRFVLSNGERRRPARCADRRCAQVARIRFPGGLAG